MRLEFYIDPDTSQPHIFRHNVQESEVADVLAGEGLRWKSTDGKTVVVGKTQQGRYLQVVLIEGNGPEDSSFVITAYLPKRDLIAAYRRRMKKKGKR